MSDTPTPAADLPLPESPAASAVGTAAAPLPGLSPAASAARLAELFPAVFTPGQAKPLQLRIQVDIQARVPGVFSKKVLSIFLQRHTTSTAYLKTLLNTPQRVDLDGQPTGDVTDEHRAAAATELERRRALHDARRSAEREAQRAAQRQAQEESRKAFEAQRQAQQADEAGRRERANLLHAFETSTLTRANFCVLKRVSEAELDATLAQARAEREQRAAAIPSAPRPQPQRPDARPAPRDQRPRRPHPSPR